MNATPRDIVICALLVALGGTLAFALAVLARMDAGTLQSTVSLMAGVGILAWLYAAIAALEVAGRRALWQVGAAILVVVPAAVFAATLG